MEQSEVITIVKSNNPIRFKKFGDFLFAKATIEQPVTTEIKGEVETVNTAKVGDYILEGASGEKYVISPSTFAKRYEVIEQETELELGIARATGECFGNVYTGETINFKAPWGEEMVCNYGDYLVSPNPEFTEAYRIERETFFNSYQQA